MKGMFAKLQSCDVYLCHCAVLNVLVDTAAAVAADEGDVSAEPGEARVQFPSAS